VSAAPGVLAGSEPRASRPLLRGWIHLAGFVATCVAGPLLIARAPDRGAAIALVVYVASMLALFGVSAAFHLITWSPPARRRMRRADHSTIFIAIAGSYTAMASLALSGWSQVVVLCLAWGGAIAGITLRQTWLDAPKWAVAVPYVVVGWVAVVVAPQLWRALGPTGFALVAAGGLFYTAGALVYARRRPDPAPAVFGYHEVFHACTIAGAVCHYVAIAGFALPRS
jgi:hemolysin III